MKKTLSFLMILALLLVILPLSAFAEDIEAGTWPDELPIDGLFENELERDYDDTGIDGDSIDFGGSLTLENELPVYTDYELPLDTTDISPATSVYVPAQMQNILPQDVFDQVREELLPVFDGLRDILINLF